MCVCVCVSGCLVTAEPTKVLNMGHGQEGGVSEDVSGLQSWHLPYFVQAAVTKYRRLDGYNNKFVSRSSGGWESKIRVPAWLGEGPLPGHRFFAVLTWQKGEASPWSLFSVAQIPSSLGVRIST